MHQKEYKSNGRFWQSFFHAFLLALFATKKGTGKLKWKIRCGKVRTSYESFKKCYANNDSWMASNWKCLTLSAHLFLSTIFQISSIKTTKRPSWNGSSGLLVHLKVSRAANKKTYINGANTGFNCIRSLCFSDWNQWSRLDIENHFKIARNATKTKSIVSTNLRIGVLFVSMSLEFIIFQAQVFVER